MRLINRKPNRGARITLAALPFGLMVIAYAMASAARLAINANDKLLPSFAGLGDAVRRMAFVADPRSGTYLLWDDTLASLERLLAALAIATALALIFGLLMGMLPYMRAALASFVAALSMVPPLALLPILFITLGLGEAAKIVLIAIGITPVMIREVAGRSAELPREQIVKAETLGASSWQMALRVVLPQVLPRLFEALRFALGPAWLFLIAAEAIAAEAGLGYRIFLVRRYLAMDVILPYVAWITLLAAVMDLALWGMRRKLFPWFGEASA
jgi:NitT/TauT family transport system permease protein